MATRWYRNARNDHPPVVHPVIRTHPVTGRKIVYVSPNFTDRDQGLSRQESDALLSFLFARFQRPEFHARLRWESNTVAISGQQVQRRHSRSVRLRHATPPIAPCDFR